MKTAFISGFRSYSDQFSSTAATVREDGIWLRTGTDQNPRMRIAVTTKTLHAMPLLQLIIPCLPKLQPINLRIVKDQVCHYQLNGGHYGQEEIGRFLEFYPNTQDQAKAVIETLLDICRPYPGPSVYGLRRISENIYVSHNIEWPTAPEYKPKRQFLLNKKYLPVGIVHSAPKGKVRLAFRRKGLLPDTVIIKQGRWHMFDDDNGRTIRDRMLWEQEVLRDLYGRIRVPAALDFFDNEEGSHLVIEFIPGLNFYHLVNTVYRQQKLTWQMLQTDQKKRLLTAYLKAVQSIEALHEHGYIHRDINLKNFIIQPSGEAALIDLELSYSVSMQQPDPAFILGMPGFVAPEQRQLAVPAPAEDIYSLGALLLYLLTTHHPVNFEKYTLDEIETDLLRNGISPELAALVKDCLQPQPLHRPSISAIIATTSAQIESL